MKCNHITSSTLKISFCCMITFRIWVAVKSSNSPVLYSSLIWRMSFANQKPTWRSRDDSALEIEPTLAYHLLSACHMWVHYNASCQWLHKCCLDKNAFLVHKQTRSTGDFAVLFCLRTLLLLQALLLNCIHSKILSAATFRIIGLPTMAKIDFLLQDWISS